MFGTVARMQVKPGSFERMQEIMKSFEEREVEGFRFNAVYRSQSDPDEIWLVVGFEDEASYRANADDPETQRMSARYMEVLAGPPEWHDGEIASMRRAEDAAARR